MERLRIDNSVELFIPDGAESVRVLEDLRDAFGPNELFIVVASGDVFTPPFLERLRALHGAIADLDPDLATVGERMADRARRREHKTERVDDRSGDDDFADFDDFDDDEESWGELGGGTAVDEVISLVSARRTWMDGDTLHVGEWMDPGPDAESLDAWRDAVLAESLLVPQFVDPTGQHTTLAIRTRFMADEDSDRFHRAVLETLDAHRAPGFDLVLGGGPSIDATFNWMMFRDMAVLLGFAILIMLAILTWVFRHPVGVTTPIIVVTLAVTWTVGLMAALDMPIGLLSSMLPAFIFVVGVGDSVHVLSVYRTERQGDVDPEEAIVRAVARTGMPILFTTLTTTVGLLSFNFASVIAIRQLGLAGGAGVMMAMVSTLVVLPLTLFWARRTHFASRRDEDAGRRRDPIGRALSWCFALSATAHGTPYPRLPMARVLIAGGLLTAGAAAALPHINVAHDPMEWFDEDISVKRAAMLLDAHHGGRESGDSRTWKCSVPWSGSRPTWPLTASLGHPR
ncbi:MAG: MMPL family transporter [Myxococcota bacterium]|nr:MMPL family transporter [Myxococcota bacterium]